MDAEGTTIAAAGAQKADSSEPVGVLRGTRKNHLPSLLRLPPHHWVPWAPSSKAVVWIGLHAHTTKVILMTSHDLFSLSSPQIPQVEDLLGRLAVPPWEGAPRWVPRATACTRPPRPCGRGRGFSLRSHTTPPGNTA